MQYPVARRCFVVVGNSWAQIFSLVTGMDRDARAPVWRRLHVLVDRGIDLLRGSGASGQPPANGALPAGLAPRPVLPGIPNLQGDLQGGAGDEDELTQDTQEMHWDRFASGIINAAGIAVRNTRATEVVFVAPSPMLALLRQHMGALLRLDVALTDVPMEPELLVSGTDRGQRATALARVPLPLLA